MFKNKSFFPNFLLYPTYYKYNKICGNVIKKEINFCFKYIFVVWLC